MISVKMFAKKLSDFKNTLCCLFLNIAIRSIKNKSKFCYRNDKNINLLFIMTFLLITQNVIIIGCV